MSVDGIDPGGGNVGGERSDEGYDRTRLVVRIGVSAFLLNWAWESAHAVAFVESAGTLLFRVRHCLPMAATDAVWTLALWATCAGWRRPPHLLGARQWVILVVAGVSTAVVLERLALTSGRWSYNELMPIVPGLRVGLWPLLQMATLPAVAMLAGAKGRAPATTR